MPRRTTRPRTAPQRAYDLLGDRRWHSTDELVAACGHRFSSALHTLKLRRIYWEKRRVVWRGTAVWQYRLIPPRQLTLDDIEGERP